MCIRDSFYGWDILISGNLSKSTFLEGGGSLSADFIGKGASPTNHSDCPFVWYQNMHSASFGFVTIYACDGWTDRITTPKTALAYARAVKMVGQPLWQSVAFWKLGFKGLSWWSSVAWKDLSIDSKPTNILSTNWSNCLQTPCHWLTECWRHAKHDLVVVWLCVAVSAAYDPQFVCRVVCVWAVLL